MAHGPKGDVYKFRKLNKKDKGKSLISAISQKNRDKKIVIFEDIKNKISKTKEFNEFLKRNNINHALIVVDPESKKNIELSTRNIANVKLIDVSYLNVYEILRYKQIMFTKTSTKELEKKLLNYD